MVALAYFAPASAARPLFLTPAALASLAKSAFHSSNPAALLPHCAGLRNAGQQAENGRARHCDQLSLGKKCHFVLLKLPELKAVVVRRRGSVVDADGVRAWAAASLAAFKVPVYVEFRDRLPRNAAGKVMKHVLDTGGEVPFAED